MMKAKKRRKHAPSVFTLQFSETTAQAIADLAARYGFTGENGKKPPYQEGLMVGRLVELALANIDSTVPQMLSMIRYCAAEGVVQDQYLSAQIATKFKRKLHILKARRS
jgi:hypothetical protein